MEQKINEATEYAQRKHPLLVPLLSVALVLFLIFLWMYGGFKGSDAPAQERSFSEIDLIDNLGNARLPQVFPRDIPVNTATIVHATESTYKYGAVRQGTVSFITKAPLANILSSWKAYFEARGFTLSNEQMQEEEGQGFLYGSDGTNDITVLVLPEGAEEEDTDIHRVNVSYTARS